MSVFITLFTKLSTVFVDNTNNHQCLSLSATKYNTNLIYQLLKQHL